VGQRLQREPQPVVITTPLRDKIPVCVVEEEEPLQHRPIQGPGRAPAIRKLLIRQESGRHERSTYATFTR
jgi:hypothetical protein